MLQRLATFSKTVSIMGDHRASVSETYCVCCAFGCMIEVQIPVRFSLPQRVLERIGLFLTASVMSISCGGLASFASSTCVSLVISSFIPVHPKSAMHLKGHSLSWFMLPRDGQDFIREMLLGQGGASTGAGLRLLNAPPNVVLHSNRGFAPLRRIPWKRDLGIRLRSPRGK